MVSLMNQNQIRIAHITDLHVAVSPEAILDAIKLASYAFPVLATVCYSAEKIIRKLPSTARIPAVFFGIITGVLLGAVGVAVNDKIRTILQFILALAFQYNRSYTTDRDILFRSIASQNIDHLLITGDLTSTARADEFEVIRDELIRYGWWGDNVTILPGNHDKIGFPRSVPFTDYFPDPESDWPKIQELIPGVILVGLDSCLPLDRENVWDRIFTNVRGCIQPDSIDRIQDLITMNRDALMIFGLHHPPINRSHRLILEPLESMYMREPENALLLQEILNGSDHVILCGHDHPRRPLFRPTPPLQVTIGSASGLRKSSQITYTIFTLSHGKPVHVEMVELLAGRDLR